MIVEDWAHESHAGQEEKKKSIGNKDWKTKRWEDEEKDEYLEDRRFDSLFSTSKGCRLVREATPGKYENIIILISIPGKNCVAISTPIGCTIQEIQERLSMHDEIAGMRMLYAGKQLQLHHTTAYYNIQYGSAVSYTHLTLPTKA